MVTKLNTYVITNNAAFGDCGGNFYPGEYVYKYSRNLFLYRIEDWIEKGEETKTGTLHMKISKRLK
jgi:hypothetical protein